MTQEDKDLLARDLFSRLPFGVTCLDDNSEYINIDINNVHIEHLIDRVLNGNIMMALRPMSSMNETEKKEYDRLVANSTSPSGSVELINWLNALDFDYNDLISKGIAREDEEIDIEDLYVNKNPDFVDIVTARKLSRIGFDEACSFKYVDDRIDDNLVIAKSIGKIKNSELKKENEYAAPYVTQVMRWLREKHNLCIYAYPLDTNAQEREKEFGYKYEAGVCYDNTAIDVTENACVHIYGKSWEDAIDKAMWYAFTMCDFQGKSQ